ncbi:LAMI_0B06040g1_1 [Lachancea mirantina]|uniref:LAMI_0B06040g1_1 n=1 Tax=Lachancea mirantina TaxID=1230905 RepID=A0A1G4IWI4_9SACH|nr:LAMI_0B06040g1_1 [Lachancea mirantina]
MQRIGISASRNMARRRMSTQIPSHFKSLVYSSHDAQDCTKVLSLHTYPRKESDESIVLRTLAFPVNPSDVNQLEGVYPSKPEKTMEYRTEKPSAIAGNEGVFEVVHVPKSAKMLKPGDMVLPLQANFGTWSNYRTCEKESQLVKVEGIDVLTAATVGVNGCTAYQMVNNYVDWNEGANEWLIQNAGTSSVSKIVTQIAKSKGIKTLSVIRDRENFDEVASELENKYGATKVISETDNNDKNFAKEVLPKILGANATIKLALNSVGGKSSASIARKLDRDATMLTYGGMSKMPVTLPTSLLIFKGLKCLGFWITENSRRDPSSKLTTVNEVVELYSKGVIKSPRDDVRAIEWDVSNAKDDEVLQLIRNSINVKGKKNVIVLKW